MINGRARLSLPSPRRPGRQVDGAPQFGDQRLKTGALRRLEALDAGQSIAVHSFGIGQQANYVGGAGLDGIDQAKTDFDIGLNQLYLYAMIRSSTVSARQNRACFPQRYLSVNRPLASAGQLAEC